MAGIVFIILFFYYFFTEPKFSTGWWWGVGFAIFLGVSIIIVFILNSKRVEDYLDRKQKEDRDTRDQCNRCAQVGHCGMAFRRANCASFRPQ
jgi:cell division protein FtsW (lipid II flippase)